MNLPCAALILATLTTPVAADFKLTKQGPPSVVMTFFPDSTGSIVDQTREGALVQGRTVMDAEGTILILSEKGGACPNVKVSLKRDRDQGDRAGAEVSVLTEEIGSVPRSGVCPIMKLQGQYVRVE